MSTYNPKPLSFPRKTIDQLRARMVGQTSVIVTVPELIKLLNFVETANRHGVCDAQACCRT